MQSFTFAEAAAELGVSSDAINMWARRGCPALDGRRIPVLKEKRRYPNPITGGESLRTIKVIAGEIVAQIRQRRFLKADVPSDRMAKDAIPGHFPHIPEKLIRRLGWKRSDNGSHYGKSLLGGGLQRENYHVLVGAR